MKLASLSSLLALGLWIGLAIFSGKDCPAQLLNGTLIPNLAPAQISNPSGRYPIIARGADRAVLQNTPIELRPSRPLHFYGNIVRRSYYGRPLAPFGNRF